MRKIIKKYFARELQIWRRIDYVIIYILCRTIYKVDFSQILILSESRDKLSGNLQFIDDKIDKNSFKVYYSLRSSILEKRTIKEKIHLCKLIATSRFILVDDFIPTMYPLPLRKESRFIQVWHAMGAFKTVGFSRLGKPGGPSPRSLSHKNYTDTIVSSEQIRKDYAKAFGISVDKVHAIGVPRTDIFFDEDYKEKIKEDFYSTYPHIKGKKIILFAPTFRGNGVKTAHYNYSWISFKKIQKALGEDYFFIVKMHPFIQNVPEEVLEENFFLNLSSEREINDLLFVTDILITDYSSVIFEASLLDIKTIFFIPDFEEYISTRDFFYPYNEYTYGVITYNDDELIKAIRNGNNDEEKLLTFKNKFCSACDGHSTERFVDYFFKDR